MVPRGCAIPPDMATTSWSLRWSKPFQGVTLQTTLPHGTWPSPLSAADRRSHRGTCLDGRLLWTENRPAEGGRQALVEWDGDRVRDLTPPEFNTRTRVHEYGGAPIAVANGHVLASRWEDQRLHWVDPETPEPVTTTPAARYADARATPDGAWLVAVRERHHDDGSVDNELVAITLDDGTETVVVTGRDFVTSPRFSPTGDRLAWLAWDHPYMPWDSAELWVAPFEDGALGPARHVAGDAAASVCSITWTADGRLVFSQDVSGFWEVHVDDERPRPLSSFGADCGGTAWQLGNQSVAELPDGRLACVVTDRARQHLVLLDPDTGATTEVSLRYSYLDRIQPHGVGVVFLGAQTSGRRAVVTWTPADGAVELATYQLPMSDDDCALPEPIEVSTPDGETTNAFLYRPTNANVRGPEDERPPLIVFTHGGPTGIAYPVLTPSIAYWTTRGFAVADVNYRGSTGFGRAYRDALLGRWGELDVMDTVAVAEALASNHVVDGQRMAIRGGSAGGYTTLAVLTGPPLCLRDVVLRGRRPRAAGCPHPQVRVALPRPDRGPQGHGARAVPRALATAPGAPAVTADPGPAGLRGPRGPPGAGRGHGGGGSRTGCPPRLPQLRGRTARVPPRRQHHHLAGIRAGLLRPGHGVHAGRGTAPAGPAGLGSRLSPDDAAGVSRCPAACRRRRVPAPPGLTRWRRRHRRR